MSGHNDELLDACIQLQVMVENDFGHEIDRNTLCCSKCGMNIIELLSKIMTNKNVRILTCDEYVVKDILT